MQEVIHFVFIKVQLGQFVMSPLYSQFPLEFIILLICIYDLYVSLVCDASGLDDGISQYSNNFITNDVTGSQLFALTNDELLEMGITKIGHQEMLLDSISLLEAIVSIERYLLCGRVAALTGAIMEWKTGADDNAKRFI